MTEAITAHVAQKDSWRGGVSPFKMGHGKVMMWYFILSDTFTFSALLVSYGYIRFSFPTYSGSLADFTFSQHYWPVPDKVLMRYLFCMAWTCRWFLWVL